MGEYKAVASKLPETEREGEKYPSFSLPSAWLPPTKCSLENEAPDDAEIREKKGSEANKPRIRTKQTERRGKGDLVSNNKNNAVNLMGVFYNNPEV